MHPALCIDEILVQIIQNVWYQCQWPASGCCFPLIGMRVSSTLASLARSCRTFHEPALDCLWYSQRNLIPILRCVSECILETRLSVEGDNAAAIVKIGLRRLPVDTESSRFLKYARKIRSFSPGGFGPRDRHDVDTSVLSFLVSYQRSHIVDSGEGLFPELRSISWPMDGIPPLPLDFVELFGGYHLTTVQISLSDSNVQSIASGLVLLQQVSPNINRLILDSSRNDITFQLPPLLLPGSPLTLSLTHIELRGTPCNVSMWPYLPLFPSLVSIYGHIPPLKMGHRMPEIEPDDTTSFPKLKVLELEWRRESQPFTEFAHTVFKQTLHKLECFRLRYAHPCLQDIGILHDIAKLCNPDTLQVLELNVQWHGDPELRDPEGNGADIRSNDLASLQPFRQLRKLTIRPMRFIDLENNTLESLASSLPLLEELRIGCSDLWVFPPKVTSEGLIPFSRHCPRLLHLEIVLDARIRVPDDVIRREVLPMHSICKLKTLDVSCSPINDTPTDTKHVSSLLKILFPHLTQIRRLTDEGCFFLLGGERREMVGWVHVQNLLGSPESEDLLMGHD